QTNDFFSMRGEEIENRERLKLQHLDAIHQARFVWLHAPKGYVGPTAALEIGFAFASGVPIFSSDIPTDIVLQKFVRVVRSPQEVILDIRQNQLHVSLPALEAFRHYYRELARSLWNRRER